MYRQQIAQVVEHLTRVLGARDQPVFSVFPILLHPWCLVPPLELTGYCQGKEPGMLLFDSKDHLFGEGIWGIKT